ncbi:MAG: hypothetical protein IPJ54_01720 [Saprospiraceae bacterium]|nr:hypothetical protein [Saprospiraceae bacterium]
MTEFYNYLLEATLIFTVLSLFYHYMLRHHKNHLANRWSLWLLMVATVLFPFVSITMWVEQLAPVASANADADPALLDKTQGVTRLATFFFSIYLLGIGFHLIRLILQVTNILGMVQRSTEKYTKDGILFIISPEVQSPATFFHLLFVKDRTPLHPLIEQHEKIHIQQYHTLDLIAATLFKAMMWFHPFAYKLSGYFKEVHEYACDEIVLKHHGLHSYIQVLETHTDTEAKPNLCNSFSSFIKKRIHMMTQAPSSNSRYGIAMVLLFGIFALMSFDTRYESKAPIISKESRDTLPKLEVSKAKSTDTTTPQKTRENKTAKSNNTSEAAMLKRFPNAIELIDTIVTYDSETGKESVMIVKSKMIEAYNILIGEELKKKNPDMEKINEWTKKGRIQ